MDYDSFDALVQYLFKKVRVLARPSRPVDAWFKPSEENVSAGVCLRVEPGHFRVFPYENPFLILFEAAARSLNPLVAIKVRSAAFHAALATVSEDATAIYIDHDTRIQIVDIMAHLPQAKKKQSGASLRDERVLIVWSDDIDTIVPHCADFEEKLMKLVWRFRTQNGSASVITSGSVGAPSTTASDVNLTEKPALGPMTEGGLNIDAAAAAHAEKTQAPPKKNRVCGWWKLGSKSSGTAPGDPEKQQARKEMRPIRQFAPFHNGLGAGLADFFIASGAEILLAEWRLDGKFSCFGLIATMPFLICVVLFFALQVIAAISYLVGAVAQYYENS